MVSTKIQQETLSFLKGLIAIPSIRGNEGPAAKYTCEAFERLGIKSSLIPIDDEIMADPDYAFPLHGFTYRDTYNVECVIEGIDPSRAIVMNAHLDVVPPSEGQENPFMAQFRDGVIYGRGACDDKGQIAVLYALSQLYKQNNLQPPCNLVFHLVVEEENGGNGTLAMIRRGVKADAAVVLEPSDFAVFSAVRGAVWFTLEVYGRAAHSGNVTTRVSAVDKAIQAIQIFQRYHDRLLNASRGMPLFDVYADPMPLTIGQFDAGVWPASVPNKAVIKGLLGFLPNVTRKQVQTELRNMLIKEGDEWLRNNFKLEFNMLNNDGNMLSEDHPLVASLAGSITKHGKPADLKAMTAACDAWQYANLNIPTVVFGPGTLLHAHSKEEQIRLDDITLAAEILFDFAQNFPPHFSASSQDK